MSPNILDQKNYIARIAEAVVLRSSGIELMPSARVGGSYPYRSDVSGIWVFGPDQQGRYTISLSIAIVRTNIPAAADKLRGEILRELRKQNMANRVKSIDINVEDLLMAV